MRQEIIERLSEITDEEQFILVRENSDKHRSMYAKSGRFIIERRIISNMATGEATAAVSMRAHPRFKDFPAHSHDYIEFMYVCSGSITHIFKDAEVKVPADSIIALSKNARHAIKAASENDIGINLIISVELFEALLDKIRQSSSLQLRRLEALLERDRVDYCVFDASSSIPIKNLLENMILSFVCDGLGDGYTLQRSFELLLCYIADMQSSDSTDVPLPIEEKMKKKILNYVRTSYTTATLTEASKMLGLSSPYLSRWIKKQFGVSFKDLVMNERFSAAEKMLLTTSVPIGDIINNVGYENSSYFHKEFKRRYGMPPSAYRKSLNRN